MNSDVQEESNKEMEEMGRTDTKREDRNLDVLDVKFV
jgi:hypothetical protein